MNILQQKMQEEKYLNNLKGTIYSFARGTKSLRAGPARP